MKIRLYIEDITNENIKIIDREFHYLVNVLRVKLSDIVFVFNNSKELTCTVFEINKKYLILTVKNETKSNEEQTNITACLPLIKSDTLNRLVRQAVELGSDEIAIFRSDHCSIKDINIDKLKLIAIEALEQCGGFLLPKIKHFNSLTKLLDSYPDNLVVYANEKTVNTKHINPVICKDSYQKKILIVGPEGGFSNNEIVLLNSIKNGISFNLGSRILRVDTAFIKLFSIIFDK